MGIPKSARFDPSGALGSGCAVNIVTGARSLGKTYAFKKRGIKNFIDNGETWCYLRTFDATLDKMLKESPEPFFSDIERNNEFPGYLFRTRGRLMEIAKAPAKGKRPDWKTFGCFFSLTSFDSRKGTPVANMTMIVYDEFISEKRGMGYPPDPVGKLMNIWDTLDRRENRVKIFMLANNADSVNPFFREWGITPIEKGTKRFFPVGKTRLYYENAWNATFARYSEDSDIGAFTSGSRYSRYAESNEFNNVNGLFVKQRPKTARCFCAIAWDRETFALWSDGFTGDQYVTHKAPKGFPLAALTKEDMRPDYILLERTSPLLKGAIKRYRCGQLFFESDECRELFLKVLSNCGLR